MNGADATRYTGRDGRLMWRGHMDQERAAEVRPDSLPELTRRDTWPTFWRALGVRPAACYVLNGAAWKSLRDGFGPSAERIVRATAVVRGPGTLTAVVIPAGPAPANWRIPPPFLAVRDNEDDPPDLVGAARVLCGTIQVKVNEGPSRWRRFDWAGGPVVYLFSLADLADCLTIWRGLGPNDMLGRAGLNWLLDTAGPTILGEYLGTDRGWAEFTTSYQGMVYGIVRRRLWGEPEDVEDVAQEAFINLHRHRHRFPPGRLGAYVAVTARNAAFDFLRWKQHQPATVVFPSPAKTSELEDSVERDLLNYDPGLLPIPPDGVTLLEELKTSVWACVAHLPTDERIMIELRFFEGLTLTEIDTRDVLGGWSARTVNRRATRHLGECLRKRMGEDDGTIAAPRA